MNGKRLLGALIFCAVFGITVGLWGGIVGSPHDFAGKGWSLGEICLPCHTPHNANPAVVAAPLWNHEITSATFTIYSSPTMIGTVLQPGPVSKLCLSCHDGTIALDSYGNNTGTVYADPAIDLTTDLSDDHPIGVYWSHQNDMVNINCTQCHNPLPSDTNPVTPFFNRYVECATCHDPHNTANINKLLRLPRTNSELCLYCHGK
jgi:predicted CXXCH cytochrome family protein